ncbi:MAG: MG2 domain-containing protein [Dehalococcoidia bacterium]
MPPVHMAVIGHPYTLAPGSQGALQAQVRSRTDGQPLSDARVEVQLGAPGRPAQQLFTGQTDADGLVTIRFDVPEAVEEPEQLLTIVARTDRGTARYQEDVYVGRVYNVLITTDKPVYQPGQTIHMRALALDTVALKAAQDQTLVLTVQDPKANRIMRKELTTSRWGIAAADFPLDTQAISGEYTITAEMGPVTSQRTVEVKPYKLPRFEINLRSDRAFYLPGETASGSVDAQYFFGKPVAGGQVRLIGSVLDVEKQQIFELTGRTDADGIYRYEFPVPEALIAQVERDTAQIDLEVTVIDTADHAETISERVTVAAQPLVIEAVPESGFLRPGVENIVYLQVSYPDGQAAEAELTVSVEGAEPQQVQTNAFGLATMTLKPPSTRDISLNIRAVDDQGQEARQTLTLGATGGTTAILLRPEKAAYRIGETLNIDAYVAGHATTVYLDVVKEGQTFGLAALPVQGGVAQASIDIDGSLLGTVELHAYVITDQGEIVRDRRLVLVEPAPAQVDVKADAEVYKPGDTAKLDLEVSREGEPLVGALGISIVDESVFAVGAQDPGFARTYFLLERELLEPRYEIHDFAPLGDEPSPYDRDYEGIRTTAYHPNLGEARQLALFGAFAQELALVPDPLAGQQVTAQAAIADPPATTRHSVPLGLLFLGPLVGLIFYNDRKRLRSIVIGLVLVGATSAFAVSCAPAAPALQPEAPPPVAREVPAARGSAEKPAPPRLRQFFPETLFWVPELETDADGRAQIEVPIADSITTWRVSVLASDADGHLGSAQIGLRVFQDFFVEPDLPRFLTQGDELSVPVSIFNYLDEPQEIQLEVAEAGWFEFLAEPTLSFKIGANEVQAAYIPIRVTGFGQGDFKITAIGDQMSDAVLRQVEVLPDGKPIAQVESGKLETDATYSVSVPEAAIPGTARLRVKVFPGVVSQVVEGLEGMLQQPFGCFEQTSSTTYPNVLVLDYLKTTHQINPRIQLQAEQYINLGYQRLLTFEVGSAPGGFSLFGDPPPWTMLTAYGLMEFTDMSQVSYVDPLLLERTANYLFRQQRGDGSWGAEGLMDHGDYQQLNAQLPATAYIAWALADAGYAKSEPVQRAIRYIHEHVTPDLDPYAQALVVNALVAAEPQDTAARELLDELLAKAEQGKDGTLYWRSELPTYMGGHGQVASIETTAMVATALMRSGYRLDVAQPALDYLVSQRDRYGTFYTTQSTILALKALLLGAELGGEGGDATVTIRLDDGRTRTLNINAENADVVQQVSFDDLAAGQAHGLSVNVDGERTLQYQIITDYYVPWETVAVEPVEKPALRVDVAYDRTELAVNDTVNVTAEVELLAQGQAGMVLVDLGVPPGFSPVTEDLDALVERRSIERYELTGRQILLYLTDVPSGKVYQFEYRLRARFPIKAQTGRSQAYDYYTPERQDTQPPQRITVTLGTPGQ